MNPLSLVVKALSAKTEGSVEVWAGAGAPPGRGAVFRSADPTSLIAVGY